MRVAVVTPFFHTPIDWLWKCAQSVRLQSHPCTHFLVGDGDVPDPSVIGPGVEVFRLPRTHNDYGDTPRMIGTVSAFRLGFDAVAWLDADNWYQPAHIESLVELHRHTAAAICSSLRVLHHLDGSYLGPCPEMDSGDFVDTNCYFVTAGGRTLVDAWWMMRPELHVYGDRVVGLHLARLGLSHARSGQHTVCYRTAFADAYEHFGVPVPEAANKRLRPFADVYSPGEPYY